MSRSPVSVRPIDYQVLKEVAKQEERDMTQIIHRALARYLQDATVNADNKLLRKFPEFDK